MCNNSAFITLIGRDASRPTRYSERNVPTTSGIDGIDYRVECQGGDFFHVSVSDWEQLWKVVNEAAGADGVDKSLGTATSGFRANAESAERLGSALLAMLQDGESPVHQARATQERFGSVQDEWLALLGRFVEFCQLCGGFRMR